ncbi:MAG: hypothetical protein ACFCU3_03650, partial [Verrucomicrobiales bacterium]
TQSSGGDQLWPGFDLDESVFSVPSVEPIGVFDQVAIRIVREGRFAFGNVDFAINLGDGITQVMARFFQHSAQGECFHTIFAG